MKAKQLYALLLVCTMAIGTLVGCGQSEKDTSKASESSSTEEEKSKENSTEEVEEEEALEPITFTYGIRGAESTNGIVTDQYPQLQYIQDKFGITLEFINYDTEKFGLLAATGDLPDIFSCGDLADVVGFHESGNVLVLNDLLDEYGQNIKNNIPDALSRVANEYGDGEDIYFIPRYVRYGDSYPASEFYVGMRARYDIYKEIGSPEIVTEDDYLEVLKEMQDYQREKTGDDDIWAFSAWTDWGMWPYIIAYSFSHGYGNGGYYMVHQGTGETVNGYEEGGIMWQTFEFFNKAYNMGLFDPQGFTQKYEQYETDLKQGKLLSSIEWANPEPEVAGELAVMTALPGTAFPFLNGIYGTYTPFGYCQSGALYISSSCKDPERAMQFIDWCNSAEGLRVFANGYPGVDWDVIDGVPQLIGEAKEAYENGTINAYRKDRNIANGWWDIMTSMTGLFDDGYPVFLHQTLEAIVNNATPAEKNFAQDFGDFSYKGQVYEKWYQDGIIDTNLGDGATRAIGAEMFMEPWTDEETQLHAAQEQYMLGKVPEIIMAADQAEFEAVQAEVIAELKKMGIWDLAEKKATAWNKALAAYDEANAK